MVRSAPLLGHEATSVALLLMLLLLLMLMLLCSIVMLLLLLLIMIWYEHVGVAAPLWWRFTGHLGRIHAVRRTLVLGVVVRRTTGLHVHILRHHVWTWMLLLVTIWSRLHRLAHVLHKRRGSSSSSTTTTDEVVLVGD